MKSYIEELYQEGIIQLGTFVLKSGDTSPFYIDLRLIPSFPQLMRETIDIYVEKIKKLEVFPDYIAGIMAAGIPFATGICLRLELPLLQIRKVSKKHGLSRLIEGKIKGNGEKVVIIDDLISTGSSKLGGIKELRNAGLTPTNIVVLIDRRRDRVRDVLAGVKIESVFKIEEIIEKLMHTSTISEEKKSDLQEAFSDWLLKQGN